MVKNTADFRENRKITAKHGKDRASNHGPKENIIYSIKNQHLALTTITICSARFHLENFVSVEQ